MELGIYIYIYILRLLAWLQQNIYSAIIREYKHLLCVQTVAYINAKYFKNFSKYKIVYPKCSFETFIFCFSNKVAEKVRPIDYISEGLVTNTFFPGPEKNSLPRWLSPHACSLPTLTVTLWTSRRASGATTTAPSKVRAQCERGSKRNRHSHYIGQSMALSHLFLFSMTQWLYIGWVNFRCLRHKEMFVLTNVLQTLENSFFY